MLALAPEDSSKQENKHLILAFYKFSEVLSTIKTANEEASKTADCCIHWDEEYTLYYSVTELLEQSHAAMQVWNAFEMVVHPHLYPTDEYKRSLIAQHSHTIMTDESFKQLNREDAYQKGFQVGQLAEWLGYTSEEAMAIYAEEAAFHGVFQLCFRICEDLLSANV
jgi:hypothetical protein